MIQADIAIVGAGFSAAAVAINLLEKLPHSQTVAVVGPRQAFGRGVAYGTARECHRLNVPAGRMSLYADRPDHLVEWLSRKGHDYSAEDFVPRRLFGQYVQDTLSDALQRSGNRAQMQFVDVEATSCDRSSNGGYTFGLSSGQRLEAAQAILCMGSTSAGLPLPAKAIDAGARERIVSNPWADAWLERIDKDDEILILGSGLTMVDQVLALNEYGHRGKIHVLSRRGLVPQAHVVPRAPATEPALVPGKMELSAMLKALRQRIAETGDWRPVIDGLRPVTQSLWQEMSDEQRKRFLRHAVAMWNIHRHRMAPDIAAEIERLRASGRLAVHRGWLREIGEADAGGITVTFEERDSRQQMGLSVDRVVNCTGLERCAINRLPLLADMAGRGLLAGDSLGLGVAVSGQSEILSAEGEPQTGLYAIGPMTLGRFWEIFAVPDIRVQTRDVAARVVAAQSAVD